MTAIESWCEASRMRRRGPYLQSILEYYSDLLTIFSRFIALNLPHGPVIDTHADSCLLAPIATGTEE